METPRAKGKRRDREVEVETLNLSKQPFILVIGENSMPDKEKKEKESEVKKAVKGLVYGMAMHGMVTYALKTRMHLENLFMLITMGDMLGVPVLPPYYCLRLLPYAVPHVKTWKRTLLRERDVTDTVFA